MLRIFSYFHTLMLYPAARVIVTSQSEYQRIKTLGQRPKVHFEAPYEGQKIMLLALYEKGTLRPDVLRLIAAARAEGLYVLAVNTLKLRDPAALQGQIDCYIERPNFGRDFGSYKTGFLHMFQKGWHKSCPRLLMINDSIFFSHTRLPKFLNDIMTSETEVLGATENYEIEYHLGSFCIAMAGSVLNKPAFLKYWRNYLLTDVRPRVIKRGEMKLSKTLKRCVSTPSELKALYGTARFVAALNDDPSLRDFAIRNGRTSQLVHWENFSAKAVIKFLSGRFLSPVNVSDASQTADVKIEANVKDLNEEAFIQDMEGLRSYLLRHVKDTAELDESLIDDSVNAILGRIFMSGSQIHQNAAILLRMGLPIVKLDGLYRGMFNIYDVQRISRLMEPGEATEMQRVLLERPFGGDTLIGWRRAAFMVGLI